MDFRCKACPAHHQTRMADRSMHDLLPFAICSPKLLKVMAPPWLRWCGGGACGSMGVRGCGFTTCHHPTMRVRDDARHAFHIGTSLATRCRRGSCDTVHEADSRLLMGWKSRCPAFRITEPRLFSRAKQTWANKHERWVLYCTVLYFARRE